MKLNNKNILVIGDLGFLCDKILKYEIERSNFTTSLRGMKNYTVPICHTIRNDTNQNNGLCIEKYTDC